jgi:hypothetical protein
VTKKSFDHHQLLVAPTKKFTLDGVRIYLDAAGIDKMIWSIVVFFIAKLGAYIFEHARIPPEIGFDIDQQMWLRDITHELCKLRLPQFNIGWGA